MRQAKVTIDGNQEDICYKIAPCKGVKQCEENDCTYVTSTRESKPCLTHPKAKLKSSGHCPVDFYYVWPINPDDKRRWIGGLVRSASMQPQNLHNHPINPPSKIPVKVEADVKKAICANPHLKTSDIVIGTTVITSKQQ